MQHGMIYHLYSKGPKVITDSQKLQLKRFYLLQKKTTFLVNNFTTGHVWLFFNNFADFIMAVISQRSPQKLSHAQYDMNILFLHSKNSIICMLNWLIKEKYANEFVTWLYIFGSVMSSGCYRILTGSHCLHKLLLTTIGNNLTTIFVSKPSTQHSLAIVILVYVEYSVERSLLFKDDNIHANHKNRHKRLCVWFCAR